MTKRRFGRVRKLPSGRYQARYPGPDGLDHPAPETFATKTDAEVWLVKTEADILNDDWLNPEDGKVLFGDYARDWIDERPDLRPKTVELYNYLLRRHLFPDLRDQATSRDQRTASPPLAQETPRRRRKRGHNREGLPSAQSHPRYRCRRQRHQTEPVPHQRRRARTITGTPGAHHRPGLRGR